MKSLLFHPLTLVAYTVLIVFIIISMHQTVDQIQQSTETTSILDQEIQEIATEVSQLELAVEVAQSDLTKEQIARDELLLKKDGEIVLQLPKIELPTQRTASHSAKTPRQEWWELVF
jgi:cell division protein FtsB